MLKYSVPLEKNQRWVDYLNYLNEGNLEEAIDKLNYYKFGACIEVTNGISRAGINRIKKKIKQVKEGKECLLSLARGSKIKSGVAFVKSSFAIEQPFHEIDFLININYKKNSLKTAVNNALNYKKGNGNFFLSKRTLEKLNYISEKNAISLEKLISPGSANSNPSNYLEKLPKELRSESVGLISTTKGLVVELYVAELFRSTLEKYLLQAYLPYCKQRTQEKRRD